MTRIWPGFFIVQMLRGTSAPAAMCSLANWKSASRASACLRRRSAASAASLLTCCALCRSSSAHSALEAATSSANISCSSCSVTTAAVAASPVGVIPGCNSMGLVQQLLLLIGR